MKRYAIIVSYEPDIQSLKKLCNSIVSQGFAVILVDNSESISIEKSFNMENCIIISNKKNMGIAYAQNIGIKYAKSKGAEIITFFDQDSIISDKLLSQLSNPLIDKKLCVTAPVSVDVLSGNEYPSQIMNKYGWPVDVYSQKSNELTQVDIVIASGMTTSPDVFDHVGLFDEELFIDFVDIEWCLRSRYMNIPIYVVPDAVMIHSVGDKTICCGPIVIVKHSPIRTYYKIRNSILLLKKNINILFVIRQILPALIQNLLLIFFVKNKNEYFYYYVKGIYHGVIGRAGKY